MTSARWPRRAGGRRPGTAGRRGRSRRAGTAAAREGAGPQARPDAVEYAASPACTRTTSREPRSETSAPSPRDGVIVQRGVPSASIALSRVACSPARPDQHVGRPASSTPTTCRSSPRASGSDQVVLPSRTSRRTRPVPSRRARRLVSSRSRSAGRPRPGARRGRPSRGSRPRRRRGSGSSAPSRRGASSRVTRSRPPLAGSGRPPTRRAGSASRTVGCRARPPRRRSRTSDGARCSRRGRRRPGARRQAAWRRGSAVVRVVRRPPARHPHAPARSQGAVVEHREVGVVAGAHADPLGVRRQLGPLVVVVAHRPAHPPDRAAREARVGRQPLHQPVAPLVGLAGPVGRPQEGEDDRDAGFDVTSAPHGSPRSRSTATTAPRRRRGRRRGGRRPRCAGSPAYPRVAAGPVTQRA